VRVHFEDVGKRYDERVVFRGVTGEAVPGHTLVITGPNGSGKSTLLGILCGLIRPTRGTVRHLISNEDSDRADWRQHLGMVAPAMALYEELSAIENLRFLAKVRGLVNGEERCRSCLEQVGLDPDRGTLARGFSTGMLQRLKIAQAMLHDPALLFLDEPGSNLDPSGQDWLEGWVRSAVSDGRTVVLATNDRREMEWGTAGVALAG
jgi:heme exporter protein A